MKRRRERLQKLSRSASNEVHCSAIPSICEQSVADAYYVLSDSARRKEYDNLYSTRSDKSEKPGASANFFSTFASMFGTAGAAPAGEGQRPDAEGVFGDVFEDVSALSNAS